MNIYDYAMQMEKDGENYYRKLAQQCTTGGLVKIFTMLADEEVKHYKIVELLKGRVKDPQLAETNVLENVKNIFVEMKDVKQELKVDTSEETDNYRKARDIEDMSQKFYLEKAEQVEGEQYRQIFLQLAHEEGKHLRIMENIVEFVSRTEPGNWLENAEWTHLEEY
ncbi:ferritin family protein [Desulfotalea psychrophila]|nr:ferritin family protein [Desulfocapsa sp.]MBN4071709.1 ferritin family protein [Desulfotalea psychrophila]